MIRLFALAGSLAIAVACSSGIISGSEPPLGAGAGTGGALGSAGTSSAGRASTAAAGQTNIAGGTAGDGLPCDVQTLLQHYCVGCHSSPPSGGAPNPLLKLSDLQATAKTDPTKRVGELSVSYMQTGVMPPKPQAAPSASELTAFQNWVSMGMPSTTCSEAVDAGTIANPYDTPLVCTSNTMWTRANHGSASMHPGVACIACHQMSGEAPGLVIGGTVFPTAHEPDDCNGVSSSSALTVFITEANGTTHSLPVNAAGNFYLEGSSLATPYTAEVRSATQTRVMTHTQTSGDCNGCHTVNGSSNAPGADAAPGRIMAP